MEQATKASHRETMVTLPQVSAEAYASVSEAVSDGLGELVSTELDWAVDVEPMRAMTTFDLWMALATGDLPRLVRVWKLGRERWQPAEEIPELACALNLQRPELFPFDAHHVASDETPPATVTDVDAADDDVEIFTAVPPAVAFVPAAPPVARAEETDETPVLAARVVSVTDEAPAPRTRTDRRDRRRLRHAVAAIAAVFVTIVVAVASPRTEVRAHAAMKPLLDGRATVLVARTSFDAIVARAERLAALPLPAAAPVVLAGTDPEPTDAAHGKKKKTKRVVAKPSGQKRAARTGNASRGARGLKPAR